MTEPDVGLTSAQAQTILAEIGPNAITQQVESLWLRLGRRFWAPVPWMLELTLVLEAALGKWLEAIIIFAILLFNAALSFRQETHARSALQLLRSKLQVSARLKRDGAWQTIPAEQVVPGDIVHVRVGDFVPADISLIDGSVEVDQSALTGEASAVQKQAGDLLYSGSTVALGEATGEVKATGDKSFFGRTAELVREAGAEGRLNRIVLHMVRVFIVLDLIIAAACTAWLAEGGASALEIISLAVVLLLASVPVALPAAFALSGALAAQHLASFGILTSRLTAVEDAAEMDTICIDKTGTITENRLAVEEVTTYGATNETEVLRLAVEASDESTQDPIDLAIIAAARKFGVPEGRVRESFTPFDPSTKRSSAVVLSDGVRTRVAKGAPQVIAAMANETEGKELARLAQTGARVLAVANTDEEGIWHQAGLIALADPARPDAAKSISELKDLGVHIIMATGDNLLTAEAIADRVGIQGPSIRASELTEYENVLGLAAIAELLPEDKYEIVFQLQRSGHVVGMTGDGVNDAPALRQAELGVATAGATDVAKSAAGVVLTREGLTDITRLVRESRRQHQRSVTYALNVAIKKVQVPFLLAIGVFAWHQFIFTPLLMTLLLMGNDVASMSIMTDQTPFSKGPDRWDLRRFLTGAGVLSVPQLGIATLIVFSAKYVWPMLALAPLRTVTFLTLVLSSQANIYLVRTPNHLWTSKPGNLLILTTIIDSSAAVALTLTGTLMSSISPLAAGAVFCVTALGTLLTDLVKVPLFRRLGIHSTG